MQIVQDLLKEVQLSPVLRERVALAEQRYERANEENAALKGRVAELERENAELRAQIPAQPPGDLGADTTRVLVHLFKVAAGHEERDVDHIAQALRMERGILQYHLDRLAERELAEVTSFDGFGHVYWGLTSEGRRYAVENNLV